MEEKSRAQELSVREISLIRELAQIRKEHKRELEYEKFDGYELPPRTQFSMLNKPAVSIKYCVMKFNMACIRLFEGIKYEPVREEDSFSKESMSQESEISENILLPDLVKQSESIEQQSGEIAERGMPT